MPKGVYDHSKVQSKPISTQKKWSHRLSAEQYKKVDRIIEDCFKKDPEMSYDLVGKAVTADFPNHFADTPSKRIAAVRRRMGFRMKTWRETGLKGGRARAAETNNTAKIGAASQEAPNKIANRIHELKMTLREAGYSSFKLEVKDGVGEWTGIKQEVFAC